MPQYLLQLLLSIPALLICMTGHEMAHGYVAYALGDPTAKAMGRLSFNPLKHIDPLGFILLIVAHFGWAKPVPVDMGRFRDPKKGMAITALAGPVANILMAFISTFLLFLFYKWFGQELNVYVQVFMSVLIQYNIILAVFNFLPISPLDGSKILFAILPDRWYFKLMQYEQYGMIILIILAMSNTGFSFLDRGIDNMQRAIVALVQAIPIW